MSKSSMDAEKKAARKAVLTTVKVFVGYVTLLRIGEFIYTCCCAVVILCKQTKV